MSSSTASPVIPCTSSPCVPPGVEVPASVPSQIPPIPRPFFRPSNGDSNGYQKISDFAWFLNDRNVNPADTANPLTYSVMPTYNSMFLHGPTISALNNRTWSRAAQNFMADYGAMHWDGFCEGFCIVNTDTVWANQAVIDIHAYTLCMSYLAYKPTQGEQLLRNACERRYLYFPYSPARQEPFDFTVANSPLVTYFTPLYTSGPCAVRNLECPEKVQQDPLMQRMLSNPQPCLDVMLRIYVHYRMKNPWVQIQGTYLQRYLEEKSPYLDRALTHLKRFIQGYDDPMYVLPPDAVGSGC